MDKALKEKLLKKIDIPGYTNPKEGGIIYIYIAKYGYCPLKIGDWYMAVTNRMMDFYVDDIAATEGPDSVIKYPMDIKTLIIARTPDGIEGIIWPYPEDETDDEDNDTWYISIQDKGHMILNNLEIELFSNIQNRTEEELDKIWTAVPNLERTLGL